MHWVLIGMVMSLGLRDVNYAELTHGVGSAGSMEELFCLPSYCLSGKWIPYSKGRIPVV